MREHTGGCKSFPIQMWNRQKFVSLNGDVLQQLEDFLNNNHVISFMPVDGGNDFIEIIYKI